MSHDDKLAQAVRLCAEATADALTASDDEIARIMRQTADYWAAQAAYLSAQTVR